MADIHVSTDLETLSTRPDAHILSIGAAARVDGKVVRFHRYCHDAQLNRHVDADTVDWWQKQDAELRNKLGYECAHADRLAKVLRQFCNWYGNLGGDNDRLFIWGNGSGFDVAILEHAMKSAGINPTWAFWTARDLRTLKHLAQELGLSTKFPRVGTHHDAGDDAEYQLQVIETLWNQITALQPETADVEDAAH